MNYVVFGSEDSRDVDIMCFVDDIPKDPKAYITNIKETIGIENVDPNICIVENGIVTWTYKGTIDEVNNMLYWTWILHYKKQTTPNPVKHLVVRNVELKIARTLRGLLAYVTRSKYRPLVKSALRGSTREKIDVIRDINFENKYEEMGINNKIEPLEFTKFIYFQIGQTMALMEEEEYYTKTTVGKYIDEFDESYKANDVLHRIPIEDSRVGDLIDDFLKNIEERYEDLTMIWE